MHVGTRWLPVVSRTWVPSSLTSSPSTGPRSCWCPHISVSLYLSSPQKSLSQPRQQRRRKGWVSGAGVTLKPQALGRNEGSQHALGPVHRSGPVGGREGGLLIRGPIGNISQRSRSRASCWPAPYLMYPPYKDRCHPRAVGIHSMPTGTGAGSTPPCSQSLHLLPVLELTETPLGPGHVGKGWQTLPGFASA